MLEMLMQRNLILILSVALLLFVEGRDLSSAEPVAAKSTYLTGQLLVASPKMRDPRFKTSVIYILKHDASGALGLIVNKVYGHGSLANLMRGLGMDPNGAEGTVDLHFGGPVSPSAALVLHTNDYVADRSHIVDGSISFTTDVGILRAIGAGKGPRRFLFALGYAGWGPGQLEGELNQGGWLVAPAREDLIFGEGRGDVWDRLSGSSGVPL